MPEEPGDGIEPAFRPAQYILIDPSSQEDAFEEWAREHDAEPQVTAFSEFRFEKNELRFPRRNYTEQAYIREGRRAPIFIKSSPFHHRNDTQTRQ